MIGFFAVKSVTKELRLAGSITAKRKVPRGLFDVIVGDLRFELLTVFEPHINSSIPHRALTIECGPQAFGLEDQIRQAIASGPNCISFEPRVDNARQLPPPSEPFKMSPAQCYKYVAIRASILDQLDKEIELASGNAGVAAMVPPATAIESNTMFPHHDKSVTLVWPKGVPREKLLLQLVEGSKHVGPLKVNCQTTIIGTDERVKIRKKGDEYEVLFSDKDGLADQIGADLTKGQRFVIPINMNDEMVPSDSRFDGSRAVGRRSTINKVTPCGGLSMRNVNGRVSGQFRINDADIFQQCMAPHGGCLDRGRIPKGLWENTYGHIVAMAEHLIASARQHVPTLPPIYFDFVRNPSVNACAFKAEGRYFIAFNTGTRYMLELIFGRMLSDRRLFDFVASPDAEVANLPPFTYTTHAEDMYQAGIHPTRPKSDERWAYVCELLRRAFLFLLGHEIAHIAHGHVDYMLEKTGNAIIDEVGWNLPTEEDKLERQALEADADRRSVYSAIASAKLTHEMPMPEKPAWIDTRRSVENLLFDWSFAMQSFFRLFGDVRVEKGDVSASSYPPTPLRRFMAMVYAHAVVMEAWKPAEDSAAVLNALKRGAIYTEMAFMTIMNQTHGGKSLEVFGPSGMNYTRNIVSYWNNTLAAKLEPFAFERPLKFGEDVPQP